MQTAQRLTSQSVSGFLRTAFVVVTCIAWTLLGATVVADEDPYQGKVALITGTSSGLGLELAKLAADKDMKLVLVDIDLPPSQALAETINKEGGQAIAVKADLAEHAERVKAVEAAKQEFGRIDYLFNNAGYTYLARLEQMDLEQAHHLFEVNY